MEAPRNDDDLNSAFLSAMRRLAASVTIVTTADESGPAGLTATAVCSLSIDPPSLIACVNTQASAHDVILRAKRFAINLLAADQQDLALLFADPSRAAERFTQSKWQQGLGGVPLLEGTAATVECRLERAVDAFTHTIFIGVVEAVSVNKTSPLLYGTGIFGRFMP